VPSFVAEWLIDKIIQGNAELSIADVEKINNFVRKAFPRKDDRHVLNFKLTQGEVLKIIALMQVRVRLENKGDRIPEPLASIPSLNMDENCRIGVDLVERYENLLRQGLWGKISLSMQSDGIVEVIDFDPFQCSEINLTEYAKARSQFTTEQWRDLMFCSMGFNPELAAYSTTAKSWVLARLLPLVESNYHIMELAPKGTGKSFIFENISNKVALISGGKVTPARLFI
ncbi:MAG: BREX system Lon protease-like protein BrxL, partial [Pseudanabaena sp.]